MNEAEDASKERFSKEYKGDIPVSRAAMPGIRHKFCCGVGEVRAGNVDIFYWPEPDADTSCLDIVGGEPHPIDYGATTDPVSGLKYWGCAETSGTSTFIQTTASIVTAPDVNVSFKQYVEYLDSNWCSGTSTTHIMHQASSSASLQQPSLQATAHSLRLPGTGIYPNGTRPSTVVSGSFTL